MSAVSVPFLLLPGCQGPLSTLDPAGPAAQSIAWLWWALFIAAGLLTLLVIVLLALAFGRPRDVKEGRWTIGLGLWFSLAVLSVILAAGLVTGERLLPRGGDVLEVRAHAFQWGWSFGQPGPGGDWLETGNTLHIPAGRPVDVRITAEDVIHSFWVPRLAGKRDAIPGRENVLRIEAAEPGIYEGLCAEFCGIGHSTMRFRVIAHDAEDWPASMADEVSGETP